MLHVGLTGSIGSGKSTAAKAFEELGIPVYYADDAAKRLMTESATLRDAIEAEFGPGIYLNGVLQRKELAARAFADEESTLRINALVHPAVHDDFVAWFAIQKAPYAVREAAILFESGTYQNCDAVVLIEAPLDLRVARVIARSALTEAEVRQRIARQWPDAQKRALTTLRDFILDNSGSEDELRSQVDAVDAELRRRGA